MKINTDVLKAKKIRQRLFQNKYFAIGPFRSPWVILFAVVVLVVMYLEMIPMNMLGALAVILTLGWTLQALGNLIPGINLIGGGTILPLLVPALLVYFNLLPESSLQAINYLINDIEFIDLFVLSLISGSILNIDRTILIKGFTSLVPLLLTGLLASTIIPLTVAFLFGYDLQEVLFYILGPSMSGGIAVGTIPMAQGYSEISGQPLSYYANYLIPTQIFSSFLAVIAASLLDQFGKRHHHLTGNGQLMQEEASSVPMFDKDYRPGSVEASFGQGLFFVVVLGIFTGVLEEFFGFPGPVFAIVISVFLNLTGILPDEIREGTATFSNIFSSNFNAPLLVAIGVVYLNIEQTLNLLSWPYFFVVLSIVLTYGIVGYALGPKLNMYPIEASVLSLNQVAMGGSGNIAILSGARREALMPFVQVVTRFSGAIVITVWLFLYKLL